MKKNIIFDKNFLNENGVNVNTINSQTITVETVNQTGDLSIDGNLTISNNLDINGTTLNTSSNELNINKTINTTGGIVCNQITNNSGTSSNTLLGQYNFFDQVNLNGSAYGVTQYYTNNTNLLATCSFVKSQFVNDISFNQNISVTDNIDFNGNIYQNGNLFTGSNSFTGSVDISGGNLTVSGNVTATSFNATSDRRIKNNILSIDREVIDNILPRKYTNLLTGKVEFGLIADEIQEIYPQIVNGNKDSLEFQSVNYIQLIPLLIKEVQDLKNKFKQLNI